LNRFNIENFWHSQTGFMEAVQSKWVAAAASPPRVLCEVDVWHHRAKMIRQFMHGWGANLVAALRL
jgi:hypothetical protein